jgi:tetrahydromethanopterin S-methyltransferase subunit H
MAELELKPQTVTIGGIQIGGPPGENPTVLIGSIFYQGHKIVRDAAKGIFDKIEAKELLARESELSQSTGNPSIIDVIGETAEALINFTEFVAENTCAPFLVDSSNPKVRLEVMKCLAKAGMQDRMIYNSVELNATEAELEMLREWGIKNAVFLAFDPLYLKPLDRVNMLAEKRKGKLDFIQWIKSYGIENVLVDLGSLDVPGTGWVAEACGHVKQTMGYPVGTAPANALYSWEAMRKKGKEAFQAAGSVVFAMPVFMGADFIFYGPMSNAPWVYPAVAAADAMIAYAARTRKISPSTEQHPLYKIF